MAAAITVRPLTAADRDAWLAMRTALYVDEVGHDAADLADEIHVMLADPAWAAFAAEARNRALVGFIEVFERNYAEGCDSAPVAYVEGLWVAAAWRRQGIARRLVAAAMDWARARGRRELASDAQLANTTSQAFHRALGFAETERLVTYRMEIGDAGGSKPG
jgi:aminoglycoside 6'-N-acetyltransferase I